MNNLYVKDRNGNFIPITLDVLKENNLESKIIVISVEIDNYSYELVEHVRDSLLKSHFITSMLQSNKDTELLIIPHTIRIELFSRKEAENKIIYVEIKPNETTNLPEIRSQIDKTMRNVSIILPTPISLKEYEEIYAIKNKIKIRKRRSGGGLQR